MVDNKKALTRDVIDRLLVAKDLLERIRFVPAARPDRLTLARHVLAAHDAAELALAGIARYLGRLPSSPKTFLMDYFPEIRKEHDQEEVPGRDYFAQLNQVRIGIKHQGIFPDLQQWGRCGEKVYEYVSTWCQRYLGISLDDLDESALLAEPVVKQLFDAARGALRREDYRGVLESLALAMEALFQGNQALRNLVVGQPRAEDAVKLSAFGVHANDFLALQEFLPHVHDGKVRWKQDKYGHPANWTRDAAEFCLRTFVHSALRIQDAEWIPGAIEFDWVYEHKITAKENGVEIKRQGFLGKGEIVVRTLHKGESIRGQVSRNLSDAIMSIMAGSEHKPVLSILIFDEPGISGEVDATKVDVKCVPKDDLFVREHFPDLPELDYDS